MASHSVVDDKVALAAFRDALSSGTDSCLSPLSPLPSTSASDDENGSERGSTRLGISEVERFNAANTDMKLRIKHTFLEVEMCHEDDDDFGRGCSPRSIRGRCRSWSDSMLDYGNDLDGCDDSSPSCGATSDMTYSFDVSMPVQQPEKKAGLCFEMVGLADEKNHNASLDCFESAIPAEAAQAHRRHQAERAAEQSWLALDSLLPSCPIPGSSRSTYSGSPVQLVQDSGSGLSSPRLSKASASNSCVGSPGASVVMMPVWMNGMMMMMATPMIMSAPSCQTSPELNVPVPQPAQLPSEPRKAKEGAGTSNKKKEKKKQGDNVDGCPKEQRTTIMIRNLPSSYTRSVLIDLLNAESFQGSYDFVYVPMYFLKDVCFGYAFVNLVSHSEADRARRHFQGFHRWGVESRKFCDVAWSGENHGLNAHIERFRSSPVMHNEVPDKYKPAVFRSGLRLKFPPPTKRIRKPRMRHPVSGGFDDAITMMQDEELNLEGDCEAEGTDAISS